MPNRRLPLVAAVYLGSFVALLDVSIVNVALPTIQQALRTDFSGLQWVVDSYTLCLSAFMLSSGLIGDRYGRKRSWLAGVGIFVLGSLICAVAPNLAVLLAGRVVQGIAGSLLIPGALSILTQAFPDPRERAGVIGGWASFAAISLLVGPVLGGILVETVGWQSIFLINLPLGLVTIVLGALSIGETAHPEHAHLDLVGLALSILWLGALTFGLISAGETGWSDPRTVTAIAAGIVGLAAFLIFEARTARPMLPLGLFRDVRFAVANVASFALGLTSYTSVFLYSMFLQQVQGWSPTQTGLCMAPTFIVQIVVSPWIGRLSARYGHSALMAIGYALIGLCMLGMCWAGPSTPYGAIGLLFAIGGLGNALAIPSCSAAAMSYAPRERSGIVSAVINATRQSGLAIGIALLGALMSMRATSLLTGYLGDAGVANAEAVARAAISRHDFATDAAMGEGGLRGLFATAYADGFHAAMLTAAIVAFLTAALLVVVLSPAEARSAREAKQQA
ncbi:DHA2 family efflux MFS transporter permease subunit [Mesorhizobium sp. INR15]|uniref:DHA2 family efflux MFS transporter permease subunit n=1 Tax=Mesorhizobium sp. INR15 TaxID=2654248 RepID=UPI001896564E|nr:DHA2 family efflux MFS transporter permease subunit [Mesorhizobium sp. INR15]QPC91357.1 DHA2 family efflux MFS transporter permease subunit [Mesorhizobium sp. INR15]